MKKLKKLKCNLCNKTSIDLTTLSCKHSACYQCFYKICLFNKKTIVNFDCNLETLTSLNCLFCTSGTIEITKREILRKLNENSTDNIEEELCSAHNKPINSNCLNCKTQMCIECFYSHKALPVFSFHQLEDTQLLISSGLKTCSMHDNLSYIFFCVDCDSQLCQTCKLSHSKGHKIKFMSDYFIKIKGQIQSQFNLPSNSIEGIHNNLNEFDVKLKKEVSKKVADLKDEFKSLVDNLNRNFVQLDNELKIHYEKIELYNAINKSLYNHLVTDLGAFSKTHEFDFKFHYLTKIPKNYFLIDKETNTDLTTKSIKCIKNLMNIYITNIEGKNIVNIIEKKNPLALDDCLNGHTLNVNCLIQLNDGKLASSSSDQTIRIWDPKKSFLCTHKLTEHNNRVWGLFQLKDGRLASCSSDKTIRIWDHKSNFKCVQTIKGHTAIVRVLIQLQNGNLASGATDKTIRIWDYEDSFKCTYTLTGHNEWINSLVELKDGRLASCSSDLTIKIWDHRDNFKCSQTLTGHSDEVLGLIVLDDGKLASCSSDSTIRIWNHRNNFDCTHLLTSHSVKNLIKMNDGRLASGSTDSTIRVWNPRDNFDCTHTLHAVIENNVSFNTLIHLNNGKLASGLSNGSICMSKEDFIS